MAKKKAESDRPVDGAKPKDGPAVPAAWYDPKTLDDHPDNWKEHPPEQGEVVSELIAKHGWLIPLTLNRRTGRLLNGHERKRIAIERGMPLVPVWVVDVPEEDEIEVIASLDTSGSMAKASAAKVAAIMERWKPQSSKLGAMMDRLAKSAKVDEYLARQKPPEFVVDGGVILPPVGPPEDGGIVAVAPLSAVRMVQLFLNVETFELFAAWIEQLKPEYGTGNTTDTVYECLRRATHPA